MKKRFFFFLISFLALAAAQHVSAQNDARWGVTLGANFNNIHFKQNNFISTKMGFGPQVGITGEMNIAGLGFGIDGSLLYSMRTGKINYGEHKVWSSMGLGNENCRMHYLDVPVNLKFKFKRLGGLENTFMPIVFAGPTLSFAVGHNLSDVNKYKPVSVLIHTGIGFEFFKKVQLNVAYNFSVGETLRTRLLDDNIAKNRCWSAAVTYYFK